MCFAPWISLLTAGVEWVLVVLVLLLYRRSLVARFSAVFIFTLGLYQFTEFMLCKTANPLFWAHIGFLTYTFLPALGMHFVMRLINDKSKAWLCYAPPIIFSLLSFASPGFVATSTCHTLFISTQLVFFSQLVDKIIMPFYGAYYFGFIIIMSLIAFRESQKAEAEKKRIILTGLLGVLIATIPAFFFIVLLPSFAPQFPSVYCEFALLMAIAAFAVAEMDYKRIKKISFRK
jgi:hypothetical protein